MRHSGCKDEYDFTPASVKAKWHLLTRKPVIAGWGNKCSECRQLLRVRLSHDGTRPGEDGLPF